MTTAILNQRCLKRPRPSRYLAKAGIHAAHRRWIPAFAAMKTPFLDAGPSLSPGFANCPLADQPEFHAILFAGKGRGWVMDASSKLAAAVVAAAAIVVVGYACYTEHARSRDIDQAQADLAALHQQQKTEPATGSQTRQSDPLIATDVAELKTQYRHLAPNERCVDGVVIVVNGSSYTQPGPVGRSVRCSGSYAER